MEESSVYAIYYGEGIKPETEFADVVVRLADAFKLSEEKAEQFILNTQRIIKSGLSQATAELYHAKLHEIGMDVEIRTVDQKEAAPAQVTEPPAVPAPPPADSVRAEGEAASSDVPVREMAVEFNGSGLEYFKIWIVNMLLSVVTLGIYSAWAKVRNKQYFYGNTVIDGSAFQYTAKPLQILKGRLIAMAFFIVYMLVSENYPALSPLLGLAFLFILPWIVVRSLKFNAWNSMFRNVRFRFNGTKRSAVSVFIAIPFFIPFTLGLIIPYLWFRRSAFIADNHAFGTTAFQFKAGLKPYFQVFFVGITILLVTFVLMAGLGSSGNPLALMVIIPLFILVYLLIMAYSSARLGNVFYNSTTFADHGFNSQLETGKLARLYITNALGIVFTLGLFIPWAKVRMARYRAQCLSLNVAGSLDGFVAAEEEQVSALGDEMSEIFDTDVAAI